MKTHKECNECNETKPLDKFNKKVRGYLNTTAKCKQCINELAADKKVEILNDVYKDVMNSDIIKKFREENLREFKKSK